MLSRQCASYGRKEKNVSCPRQKSQNTKRVFKLVHTLRPPLGAPMSGLAEPTFYTKHAPKSSKERSSQPTLCAAPAPRDPMTEFAELALRTNDRAESSHERVR